MIWPTVLCLLMEALVLITMLAFSVGYIIAVCALVAHLVNSADDVLRVWAKKVVRRRALALIARDKKEEVLLLGETADDGIDDSE